MYEKCFARLRMLRVILQNGYFDDNTYECQVIKYDPASERIYLVTGDNKLPRFSLDGFYSCKIETEEGEIEGQGIIRERYANSLGRVVEMEVQNGFYKNPVN